jgi:sialate O-acetylesterase
VPDTPALVWFRKEFTMPDPVPTGRMTVLLGQVERMDTVFINGTQIGGSAWVENPRRYGIRAGLLKPGKNVIAIRVLKSKPVGGFLSKPEQLMIQMGDSSVPLAGKWKAKLSVDGRPPQKLPLAYENWPVMPTVLYEGMIAPLAPVSLTGAIWYQAEQNSERGYHYRRVLAAMIKDWRRTFQQGDFPFYIVGLPGYKAHSDVPVDDEWAETRESQAVVANTVPNTCLATTIDVGDAENIHTLEKRPAGDRLARCALANYYGKKNVVFQGPTVASVKRNPDSIEITFKNTDGGLVAKGGKLLEFAIAGDDRKWVWADAKIDGNKIIVSSPSVKNPKEVRYAWQSYPTATLFNGEGLPAPPFRTDDWPVKTQGRLPY